MRRVDDEWRSFQLRFGRQAGLRAADSDREATADQLRRAHAEGRIDTNELEQRLQDCYAAKTYGELDALVGDLPRGREQAPRPRPLRRLLPVVAVLGVLAIAFHAVWLLWPLLIFMFLRFGRARGMHGGCAMRRDRYV